MDLHTKNTRLLIAQISNQKENEIIYYKNKVSLLKQLMLDYPTQKIYILKFQAFLLRLEHLKKTDNKLKTLLLDLNFKVPKKTYISGDLML